VEIDKSLFGGKVFHSGIPNNGLKVWVFKIVERETKEIIMCK
jgi:hypothetical protein